VGNEDGEEKKPEEVGKGDEHDDSIFGVVAVVVE
jgi:hypothetical protein